MTMTKTIFYRVETPLHMGADIELNIIDMPIQREKLTGFPKIESSGIKGVLRNRLKTKDNNNIINAIFGPEKDGSEYSSCIGIKDAKILLFPVKSTKNLFQWVTCPFILNRYSYEINFCEQKDISKNTYYVEESIVSDLFTENGKINDEVILEDFTFKCKTKKCAILDNIVNSLIKSKSDWVKKNIGKNIVVISDDDFRHFVELSTEVNTRIRIGDNGIVEKGALFTEEYLPEETILYGSFTVDKMKVNNEEIEKEIEKSYNDYDSTKANFEEYFILKDLKNKNMYVQLGGNRTLGKGITEIILEKE